jgi:NADH-quinone oxidoreductase subunit M
MELHILILAPLIGALAVLAGAPPRKTSIAAGAIAAIAALWTAVRYDTAAGGYQFQSQIPLLPDYGLSYFLGADGLSIMMLLLTGIVTLAAVWVAPRQVESPKAYYASLLFIAAGVAGAFSSLDLLFFYMFHELALIPTFLLIGIWGSGDRQSAAWKITIYLALGSFILLVGLLALYFAFGEAKTFDMVQLQELARTSPIAPETQNRIYPILLLGFGILVSLFPFHTWAPQAYASAPVPAAMLHAGVLKKFGLYGLLRVATPLLPEGAQHWMPVLLVLLLGNILLVGMATVGQKRLDMLLGYSSVMHMGYIFLGVASLNVIGTGGASLLMLAHGLSIAALFALAGEIRQRTGTLELEDMGGLAKNAPFLAVAFGMAAFASIGLPGFANFAGEVMIFFGAFSRGTAFTGFEQYQITTLLALWGVVISAVYMLRAYRAIFFGDTTSRCSGVLDCAGANRLPHLLLLAALIVVGFFPKLILDLLSPALQALASI